MSSGTVAASSMPEQQSQHVEHVNVRDGAAPVPAPRSILHHGKSGPSSDPDGHKLHSGGNNEAGGVKTHASHHGKAHLNHHSGENHHKDASPTTPIPAARSTAPVVKSSVLAPPAEQLNGDVEVVDKDHSDSTVPASPVSPVATNLRSPTNGLPHPTDDELFDSSILSRLDFKNALSDYRGVAMTPSHPGKNLVMRALRRGDFARGYVELLSQLAVVGNVTKDIFEGRFDAMAKCPNTYYTIVLEDIITDKVVGAVTLVVEQKFIHSAALRGRVEDVVIHKDRRGQDLGKLLLDTATILDGISAATKCRWNARTP